MGLPLFDTGGQLGSPLARDEAQCGPELGVNGVTPLAWNTLKPVPALVLTVSFGIVRRLILVKLFSMEKMSVTTGERIVTL